MKTNKEIIESGLLEAYVLGMTTDEESKEVEEMAAVHADVREAIDEFSKNLEQQALLNAVSPDPLIKPLLLATLDFIGRMEGGETPSNPPMLHEGSKIVDYAAWLQRPDMVCPDNFSDVYAKLISHSPEVTTAIVWIKDMAPQEVHDDEFERFLIVEGTCDITIENEVHQLVPGDFLAIPLYKKHYVTVTSVIPCKVVLQRVAA